MSTIRFSKTPLLNQGPTNMTDYLRRIRSQNKSSNSGDLLYIENCAGDFPDLSEFVNARRIFITNCIISSSSFPIPNWVESLSIEYTFIKELPNLSANLTRLYISRTNIERLTPLPSTLIDLILEHNPRLGKLPTLPNTLSKLICVNSAIRELPVIPESVFIIFCWDNQLMSLPEIPRNIRYLHCAGNPFTSMPWINDLHYIETKEPAINYYKIDCFVFRRICRFRKIYFAVRLRERFRKWLWKSRERKAMEELSPVRLTELLENLPPEKVESELDKFYALYVERNKY